MWNFEAAPPLTNQYASRVTKIQVGVSQDDNANVPKYFYHFNMYNHSDDIAEVPATKISSIRRRDAATKLPAPEGLSELLNVLGDDSDEAYPIYRTPRETDAGMTVATGIFNLNEGTWKIFVDNPKDSKGPLVVIRLR